MDSSFREEESGRQQGTKNILASLPILASLIKRLADLLQWTEEEQEEAGIYFERPGDE
jgi:hypothetical protein